MGAHCEPGMGGGEGWEGGMKEVGWEVEEKGGGGKERRKWEEGES